MVLLAAEKLPAMAKPSCTDHPLPHAVRTVPGMERHESHNLCQRGRTTDSQLKSRGDRTTDPQLKSWGVGEQDHRPTAEIWLGGRPQTHS